MYKILARLVQKTVICSMSPIKFKNTRLQLNLFEAVCRCVHNMIWLKLFAPEKAFGRENWDLNFHNLKGIIAQD